MKVTIYFDMDGTLADLYAVDNWLDKLLSHDPTPYQEAKVMHNMSRLARNLNMCRNAGFDLKILSWLAGESTPEYDEQVAQAKRQWIKKHLPSVEWSEMFFVPYGTPKSKFADEHNLSVLFDDSRQMREEWPGEAYEPNEIFNILRKLMEQ
jgi:hypothetical protein